MQLGLPQQHPTDIPLKDIVIAYLTQTSLNLVSETRLWLEQWMAGILVCSGCVTALTRPKCYTRIDRRNLWKQIGLGKDALKPNLIGARRRVSSTMSTESDSIGIINTRARLSKWLYIDPPSRLLLSPYLEGFSDAQTCHHLLDRSAVSAAH